MPFWVCWESSAWMNRPPEPCVNGSRALHVASKFLWFHDRAAMMAFCITRSTWKVSKLFYCICDWVRVNKNNGNVLRGTKHRLVSVLDGPRRGKAVFGHVLCWPCRVFCAVNKYVQAFIQGEGPRRQQTHAHLHGGGAPGPPGLLGDQPSGPPNALGHGKRGGMRKLPGRRPGGCPPSWRHIASRSSSHARPAKHNFKIISHLDNVFLTRDSHNFHQIRHFIHFGAPNTNCHLRFLIHNVPYFFEKF